MVDEYNCKLVKSHPKGEREWRWEQWSDGVSRATVYCKRCDPPQLIDVIEHPEMYADLLGPNPFPPVVKTML